MSLVRLVCLVGRKRLMGRVLRVRSVTLMARVRLVSREGLMLLMLVGEDRVVLNGLAQAVLEDHRRRVGLLQLLPRRSSALTRNIEGVGDVGVGSPGRAIGHGAVEGGRRGEQVLRIRCLGRLLGSVRLRLVGRRGMRSRRLFVWLAGVRRRKAHIASKAGLGEVQARVAVGPRRPQS